MPCLMYLVQMYIVMMMGLWVCWLVGLDLPHALYS